MDGMGNYTGGVQVIYEVFTYKKELCEVVRCNSVSGKGGQSVRRFM